MIRKKMTIINRLGLHARAAAKFVNLTSKFQSDIQVVKNDKTVNGKSIMGIMMLAAAKGTTLEIIASGTDEEAAIYEIEQLLQNRFGEGE